jgi:hypothetical protein
MTRSPPSAAWRTLVAPPPALAEATTRFDLSDLQAHRTERAAFVRWQTGRAEAERRSTARLGLLLLGADAILLVAEARGLPTGGWLDWLLVLLALVSGGLLSISAVLVVLGLWRQEAGAGVAAETTLANPHQLAATFPDAAALRAAFHQTVLAELERQTEAEWLRVARAARAQARMLRWAAGFSVAGFVLVALAVVVLAASGI